MNGSLFQEIRALENSVLGLEGPERLSRLLQEVVSSVTRWSGADRVSLIHFDWDDRRIRHFIRGGAGWADVITTVEFDELDAGLSGWALRTGEVALSLSGASDSRESPEVQRRRRETNCGAILVAPLGGTAHRLGTLTLINRPEQGDFTDADARELGHFTVSVTWLIRWALEQEKAGQAQAQALMALRSKTEFLSNLSHELRTPLNGVLGFSTLLDAAVVDPEQKVMVQTILRSGQRLLATVDNLLELAQFETGQFRLETSPFSPRAVLEAVVSKHASSAEEKSLEWKISSDDLPPILEGDPVRIGQAWDHVLSNAVKFTNRGSITVHLEARNTQRGRSELVLNVTDTGIGLSNEKSGQWFMPFHQEDGSLTRKFGGTGLGLALSDRIVRMMGGGLSLLGEPGVGTKVRLWVELGKDGPEKTNPSHSLKILLQDQDSNEGLAVARLLETLGHRVDFVADLSQASARLSARKYDILITEVPSPDEELLRSLKGSTSTHLCLVGIGAASDSKVPWSAVLAKPVTALELHTALAQCRSEES